MTAPYVKVMAMSAVPTDARTKRLPADQRRAQILEAATRVLARDGLDRFSLEGVAREAGVAATLPRHYFDSRDRLLAAVVNELTPQVVEPLLRRDPALTLEDRYRLYIRLVGQTRWAHGLWHRAETVHPDLEATARRLRRLLISLSFGRSWKDLSTDEKLRGAGWIGFFSAAVSEWIAQGLKDEDMLLEVLLDGARRFGVGGA